jgi:hypothetical protein
MKMSSSNLKRKMTQSTYLVKKSISPKKVTIFIATFSYISHRRGYYFGRHAVGIMLD